MCAKPRNRQDVQIVVSKTAQVDIGVFELKDADDHMPSSVGDEESHGASGIYAEPQKTQEMSI
jgi:hypothetical protein